MTFESNELKVMMFVLGNLWEESGCWKSIVGLSIRAAKNSTGDIEKKMIRRECFMMMMTGKDAWDAIRIVNGMQGKKGTLMASWADTTFDIDKLSKGSASCRVYVGTKLSDLLWNSRNFVWRRRRIR